MMRCRWCGGSVVFEPAHGQTPAALLCLSCAREPDPATMPAEVLELLGRDGWAKARERREMV